MIGTRTVLAYARQENAQGIFYPKWFSILSTSWTAEQVIEDIHAQGYEVQAILSEYDREVERSVTDFLAEELADLG